jgi:hypothetical protein
VLGRIAASSAPAWVAPTIGTSEPSERLMTSAPWVRAQSMPAATPSAVPEPSASSTRTGISRADGATPATPVPLPVAAPTIPVTCVPCPLASCGVASFSTTS